MALLSRIEAKPIPSRPASAAEATTPRPAAGPHGGREIEVKIDFGKTLALVLLGLISLGGALWLYRANQPTPAAAFFALGEGIVVSGLGVVVGEQSGAKDAASKLSGA